MKPRVVDALHQRHRVRPYAEVPRTAEQAAEHALPDEYVHQSKAERVARRQTQPREYRGVGGDSRKNADSDCRHGPAVALQPDARYQHAADGEHRPRDHDRGEHLGQDDRPPRDGVQHEVAQRPVLDLVTETGRGQRHRHDRQNGCDHQDAYDAHGKFVEVVRLHVGVEGSDGRHESDGGGRQQHDDGDTPLAQELAQRQPEDRAHATPPPRS